MGVAAPPTPAETEAIERHLASLPVHSGARLIDDPELGALLVRGEGNVPGFDHGALPRWPEATAERVTAFEERSRADGVWPSLLVAAGGIAPPGLGALLASRGWSESGRESVLVSRAPAVVPHLDPALRLEAVTRRSAVEHEAVERAIFGSPESSAAGRIKGLLAGLDDGTLRAYLVRRRGDVVAVARLSLREGSAGLFGIGVTQGRRRQGLGTFVTAVAMRAGLATGRPLVWLSVEEGNDAARRMYERLGFQAAFPWSRWLGPLPKQAG